MIKGWNEVLAFTCRFSCLTLPTMPTVFKRPSRTFLQAIKTMVKGEKATVTIQPEKGYGKKARKFCICLQCDCFLWNPLVVNTLIQSRSRILT